MCVLTFGTLYKTSQGDITFSQSYVTVVFLPTSLQHNINGPNLQKVTIPIHGDVTFSHSYVMAVVLPSRHVQSQL